MQVKFLLYAGGKTYSKFMMFADIAIDDEIEAAFYDWKAKLFYSFWEVVMKVKFTVYVGNKEYTTLTEFADDVSDEEIEEAFYDWKAGLFFSFWEKCHES